MRVSLRCIGGVMHSEVVNVEMRDTSILNVPYIDHGWNYCRYVIMTFFGDDYFVAETMPTLEAIGWIATWTKREERMSNDG